MLTQEMLRITHYLELRIIIDQEVKSLWFYHQIPLEPYLMEDYNQEITKYCKENSKVQWINHTNNRL